MVHQDVRGAIVVEVADSGAAVHARESKSNFVGGGCLAFNVRVPNKALAASEGFSI